MAKPSTNFDYYVNENNWPTTLEAAKEFARQCVVQWEWKEKMPIFLSEIEAATSLKRVQQLVIYPLLSGEGLAVIKDY